MKPQDAFALACGYTDQSIAGAGVQAGKNCQITNVTDVENGKKITFTWYDGSNVLKTTDVVVPKGATGQTGANGTNGTNGKNVNVSVNTDAGGVYKLDIVNDYQGTTPVTTTTPDLKGNTILMGTAVSGNNDSGDNVVVVSGSKIGDMYYNTFNQNYYKRTDHHSLANNWTYCGCTEGKAGGDYYEAWKKIAGNEGKTREQWVLETSGQALQVRKVLVKPDIQKQTTDLNTWYYYQVDEDAQILQDSSIPIYMTPEIQHLTDVEAGTYQMYIPANTVPNVTSAHYVKFTTTKVIPSNTNYSTKAYRYGVYYNSTTSAFSLIAVYEIPRTGIKTFTRYETCDCTDSTTEWSGVTKVNTTVVPFTSIMRKCYCDYSSPLPSDENIPANHYSTFNGVNYWNYEIMSPIPTHDDSATWTYHLVLDEIISQGYVCRMSKDSSKTVELLRLASTPVITTSEPLYDLLEFTVNPIGRYMQTIYAGSSKSDCAEITIAAGQSLIGLVTQSDFNATIGTGSLHTTSQVVKGAINEHEDLLRSNPSTSLLNTTATTIVEAVNEVNGRVGNTTLTTTAQTCTAGINEIDARVGNSTLTTTSQTCTGAINEHQTKIGTTGLPTTAQTLTGAIAEIYNAIYPIGAIVFGACPTFGEWQPFNFGGYVCSDRELTNGRDMNQRLPNIRGSLQTTFGFPHEGQIFNGALSLTDQSAKVWKTDNERAVYARNLSINANTSTAIGSEVYLDGTYTDDYYIEVRGKNIWAWERIS